MHTHTHTVLSLTLSLTLSLSHSHSLSISLSLSLSLSHTHTHTEIVIISSRNLCSVEEQILYFQGDINVVLNHVLFEKLCDHLPLVNYADRPALSCKVVRYGQNGISLSEPAAI